MRFWQNSRRLLGSRGWPRELLLTALALITGFLAMPALIFFAGSAALGRYEGASLRGMFASVYAGLQSGSVASWIVLLGPYGILLIFRGLRLWWRASARLA
ncbi:MAG TPA: hypothetical protein VME42_16940 [Steroidobacteraceae bacterium]|nr:hypothetical protein [Steroidobacteraceae bacterium]